MAKLYPCKKTNCPNTVDVRGKYCLEHQQYGQQQQKIRAEQEAIRLTNLYKSSLYNTAQWRQLRKAILERDNHRCVRCGKTTNLQIHHLVKHNNNPDIFFNADILITLCKKCHETTY